MDLRTGAWALVLVVAVTAACGAETTEVATDGGAAGSAGAAGSGATGGGVSGCAPGQRPLGDGSCQPAGVPPEACGAGFEPDDAGGCEPLLPEGPCEPGTMAIPGQTECAELAACGEAPWGEIPLEGESVQYVDQGYEGSDSDGTAERPWLTIQAGIDHSAPDGLVAIAAGSYLENAYVIDHPVRIWGRCPALVEIVGEDFGIDVGNPDGSAAVAGTELHTLAITGAGVGVISSAARELLLDRLWIHDTGDAGVLLSDIWGPDSATVTGSLLENNAGGGLIAVASPLFVDSTVIRDTQWNADYGGRGIGAEGASTDDVSFELTSSVVERSAVAGVVMVGIRGIITGSVVRDVGGMQDGTLGIGINTLQAPGSPRADLTLRQSVVSGNRYAGVALEGTAALVEHTVVRDTLPDVAAAALGAGLIAQISPTTGDRTTLTLRESVIAGSVDHGIGVTCSDATIESTVARATELVAATGIRGVGVVVSIDPDAPVVCHPSEATLRWSVIEDSHSAGLSVVDSHAMADSILIRDTLPTDDGRFGDGIDLLSGDLGATLELRGSRIEASARAGVANFGSVVAIGTTQLECNLMDLDGEPFFVDFTFDDLGGNTCGCEGASGPCQVVSASLEPPLDTQT